ncbi:peptidase M1 family protein, putative [Microscilla marina ATCC 23134]|uniref:Peptidase M1 family protein, putative n=2 Tax=Microscilla marina TaxID=1027 RepID=A1ZT13_MICM2|nr:peptidase M1 family protein, putative [Microscilla marina ATCC 23134]
MGLFITSLAYSQKNQFTRQDSLKGSITPERAWWDLTYYHLKVQVYPEKKRIAGSNTIRYKVLKNGQRMQIDLQEPMKITKVQQNGKALKYSREGNVYWVTLPPQLKGKTGEMTVFFEGTPKVARRAPWDGGFVWKRDKNNRHFITVACQGEGASLWWPCKDHPYDEPDNGMMISVTLPENLMDVSNGKLVKTDHNKAAKTKTYHWQVKNPINNYGVNVNIGDYAHFSEKFEGEKGTLDCNYYVLKYNLDKAKKQFKQVKKMLTAFEHWFGPYPFYEDGFKLVEVSYLGMEHQSSVTYGNRYKNGYLGSDLSGSGWGLKFDFIIVHEAGHEWFANNITHQDVADMWIHEGFTAYSENLYLDYHFGTKASREYVLGTRRNIRNDRPVIGVYNVDNEGSSDMYYKGANLLHMIRVIIGNDKKWRKILRGLNKKFYHQTVTTQQIESYVIKKSRKKITKMFDQYLRTKQIPTLEYKKDNGTLSYRWTNCVKGFDMPLKTTMGEKTVWLKPTQQWKSTKLKGDFKVVRDFYIKTKEVNKSK